MKQVSYKEEFFNLHLKNSLSSAENIIPVVSAYFKPSSVIDIGCGTGAWLKIWNDMGVRDITGVDGEYVNMSDLLIDKANFISFNLEQGYKGTRKYDLVTSLEVAEHIRPEFSEVFIESLCSLGDVILFSAAIQGQEGTYHFNEQYPLYWSELFEKRGYVAIDCLRDKIWNNEKISWWYRQNVLLFVNKEKLAGYEQLNMEYNRTGGKVLSIVHPELLKIKLAQIKYLKKSLHNPFMMAGYYVKKIFRG